MEAWFESLRRFRRTERDAGLPFRPQTPNTTVRTSTRRAEQVFLVPGTASSHLSIASSKSRTFTAAGCNVPSRSGAQTVPHPSHLPPDSGSFGHLRQGNLKSLGLASLRASGRITGRPSVIF
jgi:hypothetical protein